MKAFRWFVFATILLWHFVGPSGSALASIESPAMDAGGSEQSIEDFGKPCGNPAPVQGAEKKGSAIEQPRIDPDRPLTQPDYPLAAKRANWQGTVMLQIYVTDRGEVARAGVYRSSGWSLLDDSAKEHAREWSLKPGRVDGKPACMWVIVPVSFKLSDYMPGELSSANVTPQALAAAQAVLGVDAFLKELSTAARSGKLPGGTIDANVVSAVVTALTQRAEWTASMRDLAAMLALEFTPAELEELRRLWGEPVMRKFVGVQQKFQEEIKKEQLRLGAMSSCMLAMIAISQTEASNGVRADGAALRQAVELLAPYCGCVSDHVGEHFNPDAGQQACGAPPKISLIEK